MRNNSLQQITRIKLEELHKHYQKLNDYYNQIEKDAEQNSDITKKLQILYEGLQKLTFGKAKIHPEVENFDVIWAEIQAGSATPDFLDYWLGKLQKEIKQGRQRLEAGLVFGLVLEEFAFDTHQKNISTLQQETQKKWWDIWQSPSNENIEGFRNWVKEHTKAPQDFSKEFNLFVDRSNFNTQENAHLQENEDDYEYGRNVSFFNEFDAQRLFYYPINAQEVKQQLAHIISHTYRHSDIKSEAKQAFTNDSLIAEITGALRIMHQNIESWDWKKNEGQITSVWTQNKWRPFQYTNLLDTLFLEIIAKRWYEYFKTFVFAPTFETNTYLSRPTIKDQREQIIDDFFLSFIQKRNRYNISNDGYSNTSNAKNLEDDTTADKLLGALIREIRYFQWSNDDTDDTEKELFITHIDIKDFLLMIPHGIMLEALNMCGISGKYLNFFEKYIKVAYEITKKNITPKKGMPVSNVLSMLLGDVLLKIWQNAISNDHVFVFRQLDDIYIISDESNYSEFALDYTKIFLEICGFEINLEKFGAIEIQRNPQKSNQFSYDYIEQINQKPQWQFLELYADGVWRPNLPKIEKYKQNMIAEIKNKNTIIEMTKSYNQHINYLLKGLAPAKELGTAHYEAINQVLSSVFVHIFGENKSIFDFLKSTIITRFPHLTDAILRLPKAWFFFPITAGGLALLNPINQIAYLQKQQIRYLKRNEKLQDDISNFQDKDEIYEFIKINNIKDVYPISTLGMENLLRDFISRGGEVRGTIQTDLGTYWKWLIYTYGYELLDAFGTFRFLLTELIPLQAIYQNIGQNDFNE